MEGLGGGGRDQLQVKKNSGYQNKTPNLNLVMYLLRDSPPHDSKKLTVPLFMIICPFKTNILLENQFWNGSIILHLKFFIQIMLCIKFLWSARLITANENEHFFATLHSLKILLFVVSIFKIDTEISPTSPKNINYKAWRPGF